ncbi:MAG TPA: metallophosphoesterase [Fimbriimonas sp.]
MRALRIAHLTDIHVTDGRGAPEGLARTLRQVQALPDRPDFILTGGDQVMDVFRESEEAFRTQWSVFHSLMRDELELPIEHCIGNHDVWGWGEREGKRRAMEQLGLSHAYRSFDRNGWHLVVLDSTHPFGDGYTAKLDEPQYEWLEADLASTALPVLIVSHIPILSAAAFLDGEHVKEDGDWHVPGAWMHVDVKRLKALFGRHPRVKACLSGHLHLVDRVDYNGVSYYCNGAVCGAWWNGCYQECAPGYALVDLYDDGKVECRYHPTQGLEPNLTSTD